MVTKELPKEVLEIAVSLKMKIEKYYEQLDKQVLDRSTRYSPKQESVNVY
jgi:KaiC/GvpD/RAD55 family RecA-like ATPase